ncbi:MAG: nucleoside hydrolase [Bacillota bacterium]|nr:nucleoside hydrolase [Bacillota bacterium]
MNRIPIIIDTDLGDDVDDAAALIMALNSPELDIVGITTVYRDTRKRVRMVKDICRLAGREDIPVIAGRASGIMDNQPNREEPLQYEAYEFLDLQTDEPYRESDAARFILDRVKSTADLMIVGMGMMTNLALAFLMEPETMRNSRIVAMGGMFDAPVPEWNLKCDPYGARIVMDQAVNLIMFGLEVTKHLKLSDEKMQMLCPAENKMMQHYLKGVRCFREKTGFTVTLHDAVLIAYLVRPEIAKLKRCDFTAEITGDLTKGSVYKQINGYDLEQVFHKQFYYAESVSTEEFMNLVGERLR